MSLFKRAYVRGMNDELVRLGYCRYASKEAADAIADAVGDQMPQDPAAAAMAGPGGPGGPGEAPVGEPVSPETAADVAATLIDAANKLVSETGGAGMEGPEAEALKTSAAQDLTTRAYQQAEAVMFKAAEETKLALGSTIEGGDKGNTMAESQLGETAMENKNRPQGMHVTGVGQTDYPVGQGAVGTEQSPAPHAPSNSPSGSNSVIEQTKKGQLEAIIRKIAAEGMGSTIGGGDKGNTLAQAGGLTGEGKLEADRRPEGYAMGARGKGWGEVPSSAVVGTEQKHPHTPSETPAGTNSVIQASKTGAEDPFIALFQKTATEVAGYLPASMPEEQKIAHIRQMMGLTESERNEYIGLLHKEAGATDDQAVAVAEKHAAESCARSQYKNPYGRERKDRTHANQKHAEMPPALAAALSEKKEDKGEDKKEEKKEEKHEFKETPAEEKKEEEAKKESADLLSRIRRISQSSQARV